MSKPKITPKKKASKLTGPLVADKSVKNRKSKPKSLDAIFKKATFYVGTKSIHAAPMTLGEYNKVRGWDIPANENPKTNGYIVKYPDGYVSWSPKWQFENAYEASGKMSFGTAVHLMKQGFKMARAGWNGKGMWVIYIPGTKKANLVEGTPYAKALKRKTCEILPHFDMYTVNAEGRRAMLPGWLASQSDIDACDWGIVK